ncbi:MAG: four helix bundle protein [Candidatus Gracilibacteria bacterium]
MTVILLKDFKPYQNALILSSNAWKVYNKLSTQCKFHPGGQFIRSVDSIGANIAEGYGRYHYSDKNKFYYNAIGSLTEVYFWLDILRDREFVLIPQLSIIQDQLNELLHILNKMILDNKSLKNFNSR